MVGCLVLLLLIPAAPFVVIAWIVHPLLGILLGLVAFGLALSALE